MLTRGIQSDTGHLPKTSGSWRRRTGVYVLGLSGALCALLAPTLPAQAHMNLITLNHFVQRDTQVVLAELTRHTAQTAALSRIEAFELGGGHTILVVGVSQNSGEMSEQLHAPGVVRTFTTTIKPGQLLAFVETAAPLSPADAEAIVLSHTGNRGLYLLTPAAHRRLIQNPLNLVHAVDLTENPLPGSAVDAGELSAALQRRVSVKKHLPAALPRSSPIEAERLMGHLRVLSGVDPIARAGQPGKTTLIPERGSDEGRELTRSYLLQQFEAVGAQAETWCYQSGFRKGCNVLARVDQPASAGTLVFTSHLDSVRNAGADDNASGTAALLELARVFAQEGTRADVAFVAFDQEELGLIGSREMARKLQDELDSPLIGVVNMDMIGFDRDDDGSVHIMDCGRSDSQFLRAAAEQALQAWGLNLTPVEACTNRSDHASFWKASLPALMVSENFFGGDSNTCYHKACDRIDLINERTFRDTVSLVYGTAQILMENLTAITEQGGTSGGLP